MKTIQIIYRIGNCEIKHISKYTSSTNCQTVLLQAQGTELIYSFLFFYHFILSVVVE